MMTEQNSWLVWRNLRHCHCHIPHLRLGARSERHMIELPHYLLIALFAALIILSPRRAVTSDSASSS